MTEKQIEKVILTWLNYRNRCFAFKVNTIGIYDSTRKIYRKNKNRFIIKGTADIICVYRGHFIAIEVKTPKGIVSKDQIRFLDSVIHAGGLGIVARSLNDVISFITLLDDRSSARSQTSSPGNQTVAVGRTS